MGFASAGSADQDQIALMIQEVSTGQVPDERLVDGRWFEVELVQFLGQRQRGVLSVRVRLNDTGVCGKALAAGQSLRNTLRHHGLEQVAQQIVVTETAMTVLGEGRMIRHRVGQIEAA